MNSTQMKTISPKPRILMVDNDQRLRDSYETLLKYWGYEPILALGEGKTLFTDALEKAKKSRCILALIDLRLTDDYDEDDISGLKLAEEIRPVKSIVLSGFQNQKILREMLEKYKDIPFLSKSDAPEKRKQVLDTEVGKVCAVKRGLQINPPGILEGIARNTFSRSLPKEYRDQIADIFAQLFPGASNLKLEKLDSSLSYSQVSTVPRPQSIVFRVYEEDYEPVVVKLARAEKIREEVSRYEKYIGRKVGGNFIAKLERYSLLWDVGGALYSYIGDFDVKTFSRYYEEHPIEDIGECLTSFFTVLWSKSYERRQLQKNISLHGLYEKAWGNWYEKRVEKFSPNPLQQVVDIQKSLGLPEPIEWFKKNIVENKAGDLSIVDLTYEAVTHGDLHGDNILIDSRKNVWVIDFERSGEGHALQDFIELESDILNRLEGRGNDFTADTKIAILIARQDEIKPLDENEIQSMEPPVRKALRAISLLRTLAKQCTTLTDARQYLLGLLFNMIFRATINHSDKTRIRQTRALLLASVFCHRLEHWDKLWPPPEWKSKLM